MRVSLHCQGCAGKLKKHLSKMEGTYIFDSSINYYNELYSESAHACNVNITNKL